MRLRVKQIQNLFPSIQVSPAKDKEWQQFWGNKQPVDSYQHVKDSIVKLVWRLRGQ